MTLNVNDDDYDRLTTASYIDHFIPLHDILLLFIGCILFAARVEADALDLKLLGSQYKNTLVPSMVIDIQFYYS